jgi:hypothetical protein
MGKKRNACRILVENPEGKRPLGRLKPRRVNNNNKVDLMRNRKERHRLNSSGSE